MSFTLIVFLLLTLGIPFLAFAFSGKDPSVVNKNALVIAHRGASGYAPENTLASFEKAIDLGADMVELDVHLCGDKTVVVIHDDQLSRTTNGRGPVEGKTIDDIKALDAGSWFSPEFRNEKVPTLEEVLQLCKGRIKVLIELKWPAKGIYPDLVESVLAVVRANQAEHEVILQSFEPAYLDQLAEIRPKIAFHQLIFGCSRFLPVYFDRRLRLKRFSPYTAALSVNIFFLYLSRRFVKQMHKEGRMVYAFTPQKESDMLKIFNRGADGIISNYPDRCLRILGRQPVNG